MCSAAAQAVTEQRLSELPMLACAISQHWSSMMCFRVALQPVIVVCGYARIGFASANQNLSG